MNNYKIIAKETKSLTIEDWKSFVSNFNSVFEKSFSLKYFKNKYFQSSKGFSFHGILYFEKQIVGMVSIIPRLYKINFSNEHVGLVCDAFILKNHRQNEFFLKNMSESAIDLAKINNINRFISIPNQNAYSYWKYFASWKDIGELNYYFIPVKISKLINKNFYFLDYLSSFLFKSITLIFLKIFSDKSLNHKNFFILKNKSFYEERFSDNYIKVVLKDKSSFVYKIYNENGIITAYILDFNPISKKGINEALFHILFKEMTKIDLIVYIGNIKIKPFYFIKVPDKKVPRKLNFIGLSFVDNDFDFFDINKWEISLANFDNR